MARAEQQNQEQQDQEKERQKQSDSRRKAQSGKDMADGQEMEMDLEALGEMGEADGGSAGRQSRSRQSGRSSSTGKSGSAGAGRRGATPKSEEHIRTGLDSEQAAAVVMELQQVVVDTLLLAIKTQGVHWNVVGANFYGIHNLTRQQYVEMQAALDVLAERIRALGHPVRCSMDDIHEMGSVELGDLQIPSMEMVEQLSTDHEAIASHLRSAIRLCEEQEDPATEDLLADRLAAHEKHIWMLKALLQG